MEVIKYPDKKAWENIIERPVKEVTFLDSIVQEIINNVSANGDKSLLQYSEKFDNVKLESLQVTPEEISGAENMVNEELKEAIQLAIQNIRVFHESQQTTINKITTTNGVECWQKPVPIEKVGLYIPGGTAPLFSTVIMLAVPAKIAGCKEIILCTPPMKDGRIHPAIIFAAGITGITKIYKTGGAQAIAAMAYGTETIPRVHKIFGPGNQYVTAAKQLLARSKVAIDMPAGPSEVEVIADKTAVPEFIATDLLSQAEHGTDSQVILVSSSENMIEKAIESVNNLLEQLPRKEYASKSLENSKCVLLKSDDEIVEFTNMYAPEHLIISTKNADILAEKIVNAGSVFIGNFTPESAGDYASGTNHTLPTNGWAKQYSGVNLDSFIKKITFQKITKEGLKNIGHAIELMAEAESLHAHKLAVSVRLKKTD